MLRLGGRMRGPLTTLSPTEFAKLPSHMAIALSEHQLLTRGSVGRGGGSGRNPTPKEKPAAGFRRAQHAKVDQSDSASDSTAASIAADLLATCLQLPIPEWTLFDAQGEA